MDDLKWERVGTLSGLVVIVLGGAGFALAPIAPPLTSTTAKVATYFADNRSGILAQNFVFLLASGALLWFVSSLRSYMRRAEGDNDRLSAAAFGAGVVAVAASVIGVIFPIALALRANSAVDPAIVRTVYDLGTVSYMIGFLPFGVMFGATGLLAFRKNAFPRWLGWVSIVGALLMFAFSSGFLFDSGPLSPGNAWGNLGLVVFGVWFIGTTVVMYRHLGPSPQPSARRITPRGRVAPGH